MSFKCSKAGYSPLLVWLLATGGGVQGSSKVLFKPIPKGCKCDLTVTYSVLKTGYQVNRGQQWFETNRGTPRGNFSLPVLKSYQAIVVLSQQVPGSTRCALNSWFTYTRVSHCPSFSWFSSANQKLQLFKYHLQIGRERLIDAFSPKSELKTLTWTPVWTADQRQLRACWASTNKGWASPQVHRLKKILYQRLQPNQEEQTRQQ